MPSTPTNVEYCFVTYLQTQLTSLLGSSPNVYAVMLPENCISATNPTAITYRSIVNVPLYQLSGQNPLMRLELQLDCDGYTMADSVLLALGIDKALSGGSGDGGTIKQIIKMPSQVDGFKEASRSFCRSLEYSVWYVAS